MPILRYSFTATMPLFADTPYAAAAHAYRSAMHATRDAAMPYGAMMPRFHTYDDMLMRASYAARLIPYTRRHTRLRCLMPLLLPLI